jgi:menaquinone-dependent protoporphyrinogen oxidase
MRERRILIIYGTSYGQTARIAKRLGELISRQGHQVTLVDAKVSGPAVSLDHYDGVIVGSSVIVRGHQRAIRRFVETNRSALNRTVSAFYSVTASAGSMFAESRDAAHQLLERFLVQTDWHPRLTASMAGAVNYTQYNPLLRWYMKRASRVNGGSTDTSRDHEYTDWAQVEHFADDFVRLVEKEAERRRRIWPPPRRACDARRESVGARSELEL